MTTPAATPQRMAWLTLRRIRGESITYRDGDLAVELVAVPTRPEALQVDSGESLVVSSRELDWLVDPDELVDADGLRVEPRTGATITRLSGDVYRIAPTNVSDDAWNWSDPLETWRRIHSAKRN